MSIKPQKSQQIQALKSKLIGEIPSQKNIAIESILFKVKDNLLRTKCLLKILSIKQQMKIILLI